jgi:outer membrane lipoprotein
MEMPMFTDQSAGRFLVRHREPLNPAVFTTGRRVTVVGTVADPLQRKVGDLDYRYAVLESQSLTLWPIEAASRYSGYPPYAYDPFWGPYWYHNPYWYRRYRVRRARR